jgi:hypothetical protein
MLTRASFHRDARPIVVSLFGQTLECKPYEFSTMSLGWSGSGRVSVPYGAPQPVCWLNVRITVVKSKDLPVDGPQTLPGYTGSSTDGGGGTNQKLKLTRDGFRRSAGPFAIKIADCNILLAPREFVSGSLGWSGEDTLNLNVGTDSSRCIVEVDLVVNGSKRIPIAPTPTVESADLTRSRFLQIAQPIFGFIQGRNLTLAPREFSTNSLGWFTQDLISVEFDGQRLPCAIEVIVTINGSKSIPP